MGQIDFLTEKETEALLESETRDLPMPDGSFRPVTDFKLGWEIYDRLLFISDYTPSQFVGWALEEAELSGRSFEEMFPVVVAYVDNRLRDILIEQKTDEMKAILLAQKGRAKSAFRQASNDQSPL
jgi:hypothetical protein